MLLKETIQLPKTGKLCLKPEFEPIFSQTKRGENFIFALEKLKLGHKMTRLSWINDDKENDGYVFLRKGILLHNKPYHPNQQKVLGGYPYVFGPSDVYLDDWIRVGYHTTEE